MDLPHNLTAERALLGTIIARNDDLFEVQQIIRQEDFYEPWHGELWLLLLDQIGAARLVTPYTLMTDMQDADIGGIKASDYLKHIAADAMSEPHAALGLARTIADLSLKRRIVQAAEEMMQEVADSPVSVSGDELRIKWDEAFSALFANAAEVGLNLSAHVGDNILERLKDKQPIGWEPGLAKLKNLIGPLIPGRMYCLAGSSGSGKSALAYQMTRAVAKQGAKVMYVSIEMPDEELMERVLASEAGVRIEDIERGSVNDTLYSRLYEANEKLRGEGIYLYDRGAPTISRIAGMARRMKRKEGLGMLVIDHIGIMAKPDRKMSDPEAWIENLTRLKSLAKELSIPVIFLCQLNSEGSRDLGRWPHRRPTQGDIAFTSYIEQNSDVILMLHRRFYFLMRNEPSEADLWKGKPYVSDWASQVLLENGSAELILLKRRGGKGYGRETVGFIEEETRFVERPLFKPIDKNQHDDKPRPQTDLPF